MLRLTDFGINTSYLPLYIINSKVRVEINNVAISKCLWLLEKIF